MRIKVICSLILISILFCITNIFAKSDDNITGQESFQLGISYYDEGNLDKAIDFFEKALEIEPDLVEAYFNLGVIHSSLGDFKKAISAFENVIELNPQDKQAHLRLENIYAKMGNFSMTQESGFKYENQDSMLNVDDEENSMLLNIKQVLEEKANQLEMDFTEHPNSAQIAVELGIVYRKLGRVDKSINILTKSLDINSENGSIYEQLAISNYFKGNHANFVNNIKKAQNLGYIPSKSLKDLAQNIEIKGN